MLDMCCGCKLTAQALGRAGVDNAKLSFDSAALPQTPCFCSPASSCELAQPR